MVQHGATWCKMVQDSEIPCITMQYSRGIKKRPFSNLHFDKHLLNET